MKAFPKYGRTTETEEEKKDEALFPVCQVLPFLVENNLTLKITTLFSSCMLVTKSLCKWTTRYHLLLGANSKCKLFQVVLAHYLFYNGHGNHISLPFTRVMTTHVKFTTCFRIESLFSLPWLSKFTKATLFAQPYINRLEDDFVMPAAPRKICACIRLIDSL